MKERWLLLLPIWAVDYIPTVDGPSHVYNAWILRQYANTEEYPLFQQYYEIDWRPIPNWFGHAAMPPDSPMALRLKRQYRPLAEIGPGRVYRRKGRGMRE